MEPPSGESTTTEGGVNYQLLAVITEVPPELHVLHGVNAANKSQDLFHQPRLEHASNDMPDQRTACAATQGINMFYTIVKWLFTPRGTT